MRPLTPLQVSPSSPRDIPVSFSLELLASLPDAATGRR
jgi:hypothetical protein